MKTFFLHAEIAGDTEMLFSILNREFYNGLFSHFSMTYVPEKDFTRIDISDNVTFEMMQRLVSEVPEGHRMLQTLASDIDQSDYNWQDKYFSS